MSDMTEDMDAEVDRQDRVIQGLRDEIERLTAESKAKDVAYETMQKYVTELEARVEELEDLLDEAFRKLVSMLIHDDEAYSKLQEMADEIERLTNLLEYARNEIKDGRKEIERLQAKVDELEANRPSPDNDKILSNDLPTAITEYLRVCGPDLNYNAYHLLSEAALALAATEQGEKDGH